MNLLEAVGLAARIHDGQKDKAGEPYVGHLVRTMLRLPADATELERCAALLHDALEDAGPAMRKALVNAGAGPELMEMLEALTCGSGEAYHDYIARVAKSPAWRVKLADIADNSDPARLALLRPELAARLKIKYDLARTAIYAAQAK